MEPEFADLGSFVTNATTLIEAVGLTPEEFSVLASLLACEVEVEHLALPPPLATSSVRISSPP